MLLLEEVPDDIRQTLTNRKILLCLKGAFKEWLICTDKEVYIFKKGFMTGHIFGSGNFHLPYQNISSVQVNKHLISGYFEISAGGVQTTNKNYWSQKKNESPQEAPNCVSLTAGEFAKFAEACIFINNRIQELSSTTTSNAGTDILSQIRELGTLRASGIITEAEFSQKKAELLSRL